MFNLMGTGARALVVHPDRKEIYSDLERHVLAIREEQPDLVGIVGMAEGWDEALGKVCFRNDIPYHCYVPNFTYGHHYWRDHSKLGVNRMSTFNKLMRGAQKRVIVCGKELYVNGTHSNFIRNQAMVDVADYALVYMPNSRGTKDGVSRLVKAKVSYDVYPFGLPMTF